MIFFTNVYQSIICACEFDLIVEPMQYNAYFLSATTDTEVPKGSIGIWASREKNDVRNLFIPSATFGNSTSDIFYTLKEAKTLIEKWRMEHNTFRPHSSLNYRPPAPEAYLN